MFETDRIPDDWPEKCNKEVDEIWVPSHFNVDTFNRSGVNFNLLRVMPEPIDVQRYNPQFVEPLTLPYKASYSFLAVGKWEERKGYRMLLTAYFTAFSFEDDVALYVRSSGLSPQEFDRMKQEAEAVV